MTTRELAVALGCSHARAKELASEWSTKHALRPSRSDVPRTTLAPKRAGVRGRRGYEIDASDVSRLFGVDAIAHAS